MRSATVTIPTTPATVVRRGNAAGDQTGGFKSCSIKTALTAVFMSFVSHDDFIITKVANATIYNLKNKI